MRKFRIAYMSGLFVACLAVISFCALPAAAQEEFFGTIMTNANEPPVNGQPVTPRFSDGTLRPVSSGHAILTLNSTDDAMTMIATVFNIDITGTQTADTNDNLAAAHIHAGDTITPTAGVRWGFFGAPDNDIAPNDLVVAPFAAPAVGGVITSKWDAGEGNNTTLAAELNRIRNQLSYLNFHTVQYGGGEIRGTLQVVPEPSTVALVVMGTVVLAAFSRKRRFQTAAK
jgi:hypothetical protein